MRRRRTTFAPSLHQAQRRPFGLEPQLLLLSLSAILVLLAFVLLVTGGWIVGLVVLSLGALIGALFAASVRRAPETRLARAATVALDRAASLARLAAVMLAAGARGATALVGLTQRRVRLRRELRRQLGPLGEAVHRGEDERVEALKARAKRTERALARAEREREEMLSELRSEVERERAGVESTTAFPALEDPAQPDAAARASPSGREHT